MVKLPVRFLKINNDVAIWSAPVELFSEISNRGPRTLTVSISHFILDIHNGWLGYLPTEEEYKHGGYEVDVVFSLYTCLAGRELTESGYSYLQGEMRSFFLRQRQRKGSVNQSKSLPFHFIKFLPAFLL
jgi:hypothetical protein